MTQKLVLPVNAQYSFMNLIKRLILLPRNLFDFLGNTYLSLLGILHPRLSTLWSARQREIFQKSMGRLSFAEETSISLSGDFKNCENSRRLRAALQRALAIDQRLPDWIRRMDGMSGRKYRYLINNLVAITPNARYLEIGSWAGSTACSAIFSNEVIACCIDNWSLFGGPRETFVENISKVLSDSVDFKFIEADFRTVNYETIGRYNIYLFDGPHNEVDQYDGVIMAQPALDDTYTLIIDDWNWEEVRKGTTRALETLGVRVIAKLEIRTTQDNTLPQLLGYQFSDWHNGYFIAVCEKFSQTPLHVS